MWFCEKKKQMGLLCELHWEMIGVTLPWERLFENTAVEAYVQTNDNTNLLCGVIECKFPADRGGLVTGRESRNITGCAQWCRLKPFLMGRGRRRWRRQGGCAREQAVDGTEGELLPEKVTWRSKVLSATPGWTAVSRGGHATKNLQPLFHPLEHRKRLNRASANNLLNDHRGTTPVFLFASGIEFSWHTHTHTQPSSPVKHKPVTQTNTGLYLQYSSHTAGRHQDGEICKTWAYSWQSKWQKDPTSVP